MRCDQGWACVCASWGNVRHVLCSWPGSTVVGVLYSWPGMSHCLLVNTAVVSIPRS